MTELLLFFFSPLDNVLLAMLAFALFGITVTSSIAFLLNIAKPLSDGEDPVTPFSAHVAYYSIIFFTVQGPVFISLLIVTRLIVDKIFMLMAKDSVNNQYNLVSRSSTLYPKIVILTHLLLTSILWVASVWTFGYFLHQTSLMELFL